MCASSHAPRTANRLQPDIPVCDIRACCQAEHQALLMVSKPAVHLQEPSVRQQCSGILLQYILDYPLGARRLQHHLQFLITNLSFEHESGRQASVDTMKAS